MGTSPAVLTNAVWALAHQKNPVVPDEIVVLITKNGKGLLRKELIENGVWEEMLAEMKREKIDIDGRLVFGETSIRMVPDARGNEIDDLRTGEDNLRAADFMLSQLRQYTEDGGTELHVSIAGGRKTMSALLFSCMTLLGRENDKVYHELLPSEFDGGMEPVFYFLKKGGKTQVTPYWDDMHWREDVERAFRSPVRAPARLVSGQVLRPVDRRRTRVILTSQH